MDKKYFKDIRKAPPPKCTKTEIVSLMTCRAELEVRVSLYDRMELNFYVYV